MAETAWRALPLKGEPPVTRFQVWVSSQECTIDISKARRELGYEPRVSREQGLSEMRAQALGLGASTRSMARRPCRRASRSDRS